MLARETYPPSRFPLLLCSFAFSPFPFEPGIVFGSWSSSVRESLTMPRDAKTRLDKTIEHIEEKMTLEGFPPITIWPVLDGVEAYRNSVAGGSKTLSQSMSLKNFDGAGDKPERRDRRAIDLIYKAMKRCNSPLETRSPSRTLPARPCSPISAGP